MVVHNPTYLFGHSDAEALRAKQKASENIPRKRGSCLMQAFRKRKRKKRPPQQLAGVVNSIHITRLRNIGADLADIDSFGVVLACSGVCKTVPIGTPLEVSN